MKSNYYFLFGNTPELSFIELESLLSSSKLNKVSDRVAVTQLSTQEAADLNQNLGGTVKILEQKETYLLDDIKGDTDKLQEKITDYLSQETKVNFAVSYLDNIFPRLETTKIKRSLQAGGTKARYLESGRGGLSAAILLHKKVTELYLFEYNNEIILAETAHIQDIDQWSKRDRQKPYADRKKGMLPPKVARMMVNLALSKIKDTQNPLLYDPFCGTGTVLMEAAVRGSQIAGSDNDPDSISGTKRNLSWLFDEYSLDVSSVVFESSVAAVDAKSFEKKVDCIVTEPFLGRPKPNFRQLKNIFKGLEKLYTGAFNAWRKILKDDGVIVMVLPLVDTGKHIYSLEHLIDKIAHKGYTLEIGPVVYSRPKAIVRRQIIVLRYKK